MHLNRYFLSRKWRSWGQRWPTDRGGLHCLFVAAVAIVMTIAMSAAPEADPWLDRVENNLRRIQATSKYTAPADVGSKAAQKAHHSCTKKSDEAACTKIIWRAPDLLPIRDWAVGTAHIKRGEIKEKRADVNGALEDYQNALEYQPFPNLRGRIKRLKLRLKTETSKSKTARVETAQPGSEVAQPVASGGAPGVAGSHPVVVVQGWQPEIGEKGEDAPAAGPAKQNDDQDTVQNRAAKTTGSSRTAETPPNPTSAPLSHIGVGTFAAAPDVPPPEPVKNWRPATRYMPGRNVAFQNLEQAPGSTANTLEAVTAPRVPSAGLQFPVADEIKTALSEVRRRTNAVLTTSALPDSPKPKRRSVVDQSTAVTALVGFGLLFLTILFVANRGGFGVATRSAHAGPPVLDHLNVDDLKEIVQKRSDEKLAAKKAVLVSPLQKLAHKKGALAKATSVSRPVSPDASSNGEPDAQVPGEREQAAPQIRDENNGSTDGAPGAASVKEDPENAPAPAIIAGEDLEDLVPRVGRLDETALRRIAEGQATAIVAGGAQHHADALLQRLLESCRSDVADRMTLLNDSAEHVRGAFNPFWTTPPGMDPLAAKQKFNAGFECLCSVFDLVFGEAFVRLNRANLRHIVMLVQTRSDPSLHAMLECLERRQTLSAYEDTMASIDNVAARLFFTTTFASEAFAIEADHMEKKLRAVLASKFVADALAPNAEPKSADLFPEKPHITVLSLAGCGLTRTQAGVLLASLLHRYVVQSFDRPASSDSEHPTTMVLPPLEGFGDEVPSLQFLIEEVRRLGVTVL